MAGMGARVRGRLQTLLGDTEAPGAPVPVSQPCPTSTNEARDHLPCPRTPVLRNCGEPPSRSRLPRGAPPSSANGKARSLRVGRGRRTGRPRPARAPGSRWNVQEGAPPPQTPAAGLSWVMAARVVTLGIDLGTTSVKAALLEAAPGHPPGFVVLASCARAARAEAAAPQVRQRPGAASPQGATLVPPRRPPPHPASSRKPP